MSLQHDSTDPAVAGVDAEPAAQGDLGPEDLRFRFTGNGREYFSIWIVNLLLSLLTLGIYSAWAKVRREQYFCRNTLLGGHSFDYTGDPRKILIGRVFVVSVLIAASFLREIGTGVALGVTVFLAVAFPWVIVRSLRFRARHTRFRNLSFRFTGSTADATRVFLAIYLVFIPILVATMMVAPEALEMTRGAEDSDIDPEVFFEVLGPVVLVAALTPIAFAIVWPLYQARIRSFIHRNLCFGSAEGGFHGTASSFYRAAFKVAAVGAFSVLLALIAISMATHFEQAWIGLFAIAAYFLPRAAYSVFFANTALAGASLGSLRFRSYMRWIPYARLQLANALLIVATLGLAAPWARVREVRYRLEHAAVLALPGAIDSVVGAESDDAAAIGDEAADFLDFDVSL